MNEIIEERIESAVLNAGWWAAEYGTARTDHYRDACREAYEASRRLAFALTTNSDNAGIQQRIGDLADEIMRGKQATATRFLH